LSVANEYITYFGTQSEIIQEFLEITLFQDATGIFAVNNEQLMRVSMVGLRVNVFVKSHLRVQNRTVNDAGDSMDSVDNVPIEGRSFDFAGNGTTYRDYPANLSTQNPTLQCDPIKGVMYQPVAGSTNSLYVDIPKASQFVGCKKVMGNHLDPGQIKTSVLYDKLSIGLPMLYSKIYNNGLTVAGTLSAPRKVWLGKSRIFAWEKMIDAVVVGPAGERAFNIAFEHNIEVGAMTTFKKQMQTAPRTVVFKQTA
jgi:hypothetical protein